MVTKDVKRANKRRSTANGQPDLLEHDLADCKGGREDGQAKKVYEFLHGCLAA